MKLSIILPVYNTAPYLEQCLDSLVNQKDIEKGQFEIIAINDGSTDNSADILKQYQQRYPELIRLFHHPNQGLSVTRNIGIDHTKGEYIWFVDSDDWVSDDAVKLIFGAIDKNVTAIAISYEVVYDDRPPKSILQNRICKTGVDLLRKSNHSPAQFCILRKDFLDKNNLRFLPGRIHEDVDFSGRAKYLAPSVAVIEKPIYFFYQRSGTLSRGNMTIKRASDCIAVAENLYGFATLGVEESDKFIFASMIGRLINISLMIAENLDASDKHSLMKLLNHSKRLFKFMMKSELWQYQIEGMLGKRNPSCVLYLRRIIK